jgi:hypothetical protein
MPLVEFALVLPWVIFVGYAFTSASQVANSKITLDLICKSELMAAVIEDYRLRSLTSLDAATVNVVLSAWESKLETKVTDAMKSKNNLGGDVFGTLGDMNLATSRSILNFISDKNELKFRHFACIPQGRSSLQNFQKRVYSLTKLNNFPERWLERGDRDCGGRYLQNELESVPSWSIKSETIFPLGERGSISLLVLSLILGLLIVFMGTARNWIFEQEKSQRSWALSACNLGIAQSFATELNDLATFQKWVRGVHAACQKPLPILVQLEELAATASIRLGKLFASPIKIEKSQCGFFRISRTPKPDTTGAPMDGCHGSKIKIALRHPKEQSLDSSFEPLWMAEIGP